MLDGFFRVGDVSQTRGQMRSVDLADLEITLYLGI